MLEIINCQEFTINLQKILAKPIPTVKECPYIDLANIPNPLDKNKLLQGINQVPPANPLDEAFCYVLSALRFGYLDLVKIGTNEMLKAFLIQINEENQEPLTKVIMSKIQQLFLYSYQNAFPYNDLLWEYLSLCFDTVCFYLVEMGMERGCEIFLNTVASLGKLAAQKGLHTSSLQHFLHNLEVRAREQNLNDLAHIAKNHRFNIETH